MDIIDINEVRQMMLAKGKEENAQQFVESQQKVIEKLCKQIEVLKEKNEHLETILKSGKT